MRMAFATPHRSTVLVAVIGILALLALMTNVFVLMARMERSVSAAQVDRARARLLATAGIERAVSELARSARGRGWEDLLSDWAYGDGPGVDLEDATRPSFRAPGLPIRSGELAITYPKGRDIYILKVLDSASQVDLNMPQSNLYALLDVLGRAIEEVFGTNPVPSGRGQRIQDYRDALPQGVFATEEQLLEVPGMTRDDFELLRDFVCVRCYRSPGSTVPRPDGSFPGSMDRITVTERAPINVNTAPYPVLVAWLAGLEGLALTTTPDGPNRLGAEPVAFQKASVAAVRYDDAKTIATRLMQRRATRSFRSVEDLARFFDNPLPQADPRNTYGPGLVQLGIISRETGWVLQANADPNLTTSETFPTLPAYLPVDKLDLSYTTFEACFSSMGFFEIESLGRVYEDWQNADIRAEARIRVEVQVYSVLRQSTQREFLSGSGSVPLVGNVMTRPENLFDVGGGRANQFEGAVTLGTEFRGGRGGAAWFPFRQTYGVPTAKTEDVSVHEGSELMPDGTLCVRNRARRMTAPISNEVGDLAGTVECWLKFLTPPTVGSDEPILHMVLTTGSEDGLSTGKAMKLERYGTVLKCTLFQWGYPDPAPSPYLHLFVEAEHLVDRWQPNEWHHIAIQWRESPPAKGAGEYREGDDSDVVNPADVNLRFFVDGEAATRVFVRLAEDETRMEPAPGNIIYRIRRVRRMDLRSKTPPPPVGSGAMDIGAYAYLNPSAVDILRQYTFPPGNLSRRSNCVVDDLTLFADEQYSRGGFPPPERFALTGGRASFQGAFALDTVNPRGVLGTLRWTQRLPWAWRDRTLWPADSPRVGCFWDLGGGVQGGPATALADADGTPIGRPIGGATQLRYRLDFINPGPVYPLNTSPVVDDVTLTVVGPPRFLSWAFE